MSTGNQFSMKAFEEAIAQDPEILGVFYNGSQGRGTMDRYSDLDLKVWVTDAVYAQAARKLEELLATLGEVRSRVYAAGSPATTALVGPDWQRVDLDLMTSSEMHPWTGYAGSRIIKDTDGVLSRLIEGSSLLPTRASRDEAANLISEAIDSQFFLALHNARGAVWSAMGEVSHQAAQLYTFLAKLRGRESYGFRYVEQLLSPEELALLTSVWPVRPDRREVRRAGRRLWEWTRCVWREAERVLEEDLPVRVDEDGMLTAVDRIYEWE